MKLKNIIVFFLIVVLLPTTALAGSKFQCTEVTYPIYTNGLHLNVTDAPPMNYNGRTMLPLRAVAEALGIDIKWDGAIVNITTLNEEKLKESCVDLYIWNGLNDVPEGSGVVLEYDEILTCSHNTKNGQLYRISYNDVTSTQSTLISFNDTLDISILRPNNKIVKPVKIGDSDNVDVGDKVVLISSDSLRKNAVSWGKVKDRTIIDGVESINVSCAVGSGSSGGGVFDINGNLIGIAKVINRSSSEFSVIPINDIRKALAN